MSKLSRAVRDPVVEPPDRREQILDAATRLFAEHGFTDAATQGLADDLGVGKGTLYRYFPSKRELFLAAVDRVMRRLHERLEQATAGVEDPLERVSLGARAYLDFFREHPESVELLIQERAQFKDRERPTYFEHRERHVDRWREHYRKMIASGRMRDVPVERISDVFTAALYGSVFLHYFGGRSETFAADATDILVVLFHGVLSDSERVKRTSADGPGGT